MITGRRQVQGLDEEARRREDQGPDAARRSGRHARVLRVLRGLPAAGGRRVLLLRPARLVLLRPARRQEPLDDRPLPRRSRAGARRPRASRTSILYGQSWGSMLAIEYALKYQKHLKGLVLSSMTASIASYVEYVNKLRAALPPEVLAVLEKYEAKGDYDEPRVPGGDVQGGLRPARLPRGSLAGSGRARVQAHQPAGLQHDAGAQRVRRDRDLQGLGPLEGPRRRSPCRRSSSARATTR